MDHSDSDNWNGKFLTKRLLRSGPINWPLPVVTQFSDEDAKNRGSNVDERTRQDKADETVIDPVSVYRKIGPQPEVASLLAPKAATYS